MAPSKSQHTEAAALAPNAKSKSTADSALAVPLRKKINWHQLTNILRRLKSSLCHNPKVKVQKKVQLNSTKHQSLEFGNGADLLCTQWVFRSNWHIASSLFSCSDRYHHHRTRWSSWLTASVRFHLAAPCWKQSQSPSLVVAHLWPPACHLAPMSPDSFNKD